MNFVSSCLPLLLLVFAALCDRINVVDSFAVAPNSNSIHAIASTMRGPTGTTTHEVVMGMAMGDDGSKNDQRSEKHSLSTNYLTKVTSKSFWRSMLLASVLWTSGLGMGLAGGTGFRVGAVESYDGFAEYAKTNQMEKSDVGCFMKQCGDQTKALFSNPRGIKGATCLGRCKGEQSCSTRCFAEFGSEDLNNWLSCTIEDNECVKVPKKGLDDSAVAAGATQLAAHTVKAFDPESLVGSWYKTDGLNPNYDLFDCQTNTFQKSSPSELDMGIFLRISRPGGGYWDNAVSEHMVVDSGSGSDALAGRTMHTEGKLFGLSFQENWYVLGESDGSNGVPPYKLVAYRGRTLQGNYEGAFVFAKSPTLPDAARPAVAKAAATAGLDFAQFTPIDNTCPTSEKALNDPDAGTGTSTTDWVDLVVGEGGVVDWVFPGWRGEYNK